jgi:hypothetical protein
MYDDGIQIKSVPFFWSPPCYICPTGSDVRFLADTRIKGFAHVEYWEAVRLLLLAGFCLMLCSSSVIAEDIFKPTGKYLQVTTGDSDPVTLERTDNPTRFSFSSKMPAKPQRQWYLVSEPWCSSCPAAKARFLALGWSEDNILTMAECQAKFGFKPDHVPFEFGEPVATVKDFSQVQSMSHSEMVATHLRTSHGVSTTNQPARQPTVMRVQQSACPGGRCPAPTNRRRLFR